MSNQTLFRMITASSFFGSHQPSDDKDSAIPSSLDNLYPGDDLVS